MSPIPNKREPEKKFISRCIPIVINEGTTKDPSQAAAICHSIFALHKKRSRSSDELAREYNEALLSEAVKDMMPKFENKDNK